MISLKKGDKVFLGKSGHRGFNYPTPDSDTLLFDVEAEKLFWVGGGDKTAVLVPVRSLGPFKWMTDDKLVPVWITKQ